MARVRPTEKYQEYQHKIDALHEFISATINDDKLAADVKGKLIRMEPLRSKDRLHVDRDTIVTQCYIMADWVNEVQVYHIVEPFDHKSKRFFHLLGFLPHAIAELVNSCKYLDEEGRKTYFARIKQLEDMRIARFTDEGGRRL